MHAPAIDEPRGPVSPTMWTRRRDAPAYSGQIIEQGHATEDHLKKIDNEIKAIVKEAADFSLESPEPDPSELWTDVLIEEGAR